MAEEKGIYEAFVWLKSFLIFFQQDYKIYKQEEQYFQKQLEQENISNISRDMNESSQMEEYIEIQEDTRKTYEDPYKKLLKDIFRDQIPKVISAILTFAPIRNDY